jgi:quinol monooxygenase YgiN
MPKLAILGKIEVAHGCVEKVLPLFMAHRERCLKGEPGTLAFDVLRPQEDDTTSLVYEVYQDDATFDVHWKRSSVARVRHEAGEMIVKIASTRCNLVE